MPLLAWLIFIAIWIPIVCYMFPLVKPHLERFANNITPEEIIPITATEEEQSKPQEVVLKPDSLNLSNIPEYKGEGAKKFIFRPETLQQYIGQEHAKDIIKLNIKKIKSMKSVHFLISSTKGGVGKTTLAFIISKLLNANMIERIGADFDDPKQIESVLKIINSTEKYSVLFIDEIHNLSKINAEKYFYRLMEDFTIQGKQIKPFTIIGATTDKDTIVKKMPPFITRFQVPIELKGYTIEELIILLKQYKNQMFELENVDAEIYDVIAKNCKFTPRIAISLLEDYIVENDINKVLKYHRIIKNGLTETDIKILKTLNSCGKPIGLENIANRVGTSKGNYRIIYEPFLTEMGYIITTPRGRIIGEEGKKILEGLK